MMQPSTLVRVLLGCALLWQGAVSLSAQSTNLHDVPANLARWMYPFNGDPAGRQTASTFAAYNSQPDFDTRDAQYLLGWNTSNNVPAGMGAKNYLVRRARVTLTISRDMAYAYSGVLRDYRTYFLTNDPRYIAPSNQLSPVELFGVGYRGGYTSATFQQATTFSAIPGGGAYTNRTAFAAGFDTNGLLVDVSNNVGDDGTNETAHPFEVAPFAVGFATNFVEGQLMPAGSQIVFDLNLDDPFIYGYVQQALNEGSLRLTATSLQSATFSGTPTYPDFYTIFSGVAFTNEFPLLDLEVSTVRTNIDTDLDNLPDDWETFYFSSLANNAGTDTDTDGESNGREYLAGTNPNAGTNAFRVTSFQYQPAGTELRFTFGPSRQNLIRWSDDLINWQTVTNPAVIYTSAWLSKSVTNATYPSPVFAIWRDTNAPAAKRFYRVGNQ